MTPRKHFLNSTEKHMLNFGRYLSAHLSLHSGIFRGLGLLQKAHCLAAERSTENVCRAVDLKSVYQNNSLKNCLFVYLVMVNVLNCRKQRLMEQTPGQLPSRINKCFCHSELTNTNIYVSVSEGLVKKTHREVKTF